jgi:hypothetical protein
LWRFAIRDTDSSPELKEEFKALISKNWFFVFCQLPIEVGQLSRVLALPFIIATRPDSMKTHSAFSVLLGTAQAISIVDFDTCSIPYIIPLSFQVACDRSDEYLSPIAITNGQGNFITSITPPDNITAASIRTKPNRWTHEPFCIESPEANNGFCVYTNDRFANGRGLSIVTTPKELMKLLEAAVFRESNENHLRQDPEGNADKQEWHLMPGKGRGIIANTTLNRGDYLQGYTPILLFQDDMMQFVKTDDQDLLIKLAIERLPRKSQAIFNALHNTFPGNPYVSRIQTNAFQAYVGAAKDHFWAVIPEAARYNHDCRPNSAYFFDGQSLTHRIHAVAKVSPGEEITVTYTPAWMKHANRQSFIQKEWGFSCTCSKCSASKSLIAISDHRLNLMEELEAQLNDLLRNRTATPATAETLVSLYEQEHLHGQIGDAYMYAALEYAYLGEKDRMQMWANMALEGLALFRGENHLHYKAMWALSFEPERHRAWKYIKNGFKMNDGPSMNPMKPASRKLVATGGDVVEQNDP